MPIAWSESLRTSVRLLRTHPLLGTALGAAIVLSLCAVCTGFGAIVGPWFVCELYGVQIAAATGELRPRGKAWASAAVVVLGSVVIVAWVGWLSTARFGPDLAAWDAEELYSWPDALRRVALIAGATLLATAFIAPSIYAPLILVDRGTRLGGAMAESAWLVTRSPLRHLALTFVVYLTQLLPALIAAMIVARTYERAATPLGLLVALPFLSVSIPLGQGILTATYLRRRGELAAPRALEARGGHPKALVALLVSVVTAPIVGLTLLGLSALRPAPPLAGAGQGEVLVGRAIAPGRPAEVLVPDTSLAVRVRGSEAAIVAGDGDGLGPIPREAGSRVRAVRIRRAMDRYGDGYAVELESEQGIERVRVSGAGVRLDDTIERSLEAHVPTWALMLILWAFVVGGATVLRILAPLGALRAEREASAEERLRERAQAERTAARWGLVLLPFAVGALVGGVIAVS